MLWVGSAWWTCFGGCLFRFEFGVVALLDCWFITCLGAVWVIAMLCLFVVKVLIGCSIYGAFYVGCVCGW